MKRISIHAVLLSVVMAAFAHGQQWDVEIVDQSGVAKFTAMKMDTQGNAHLVYVMDEGNAGYTLKYGFRDAVRQRWYVMPIAEGASYCDLALDSKGRPHISWADYGTQAGARLRYAHWDGTAWQKQAVLLSSTAVGYYTSIAMDPNDRPAISFYELRGPQGDLVYRMRTVMWTGTYWEARTVDNEELSGKFNSIIGDSLGHMHLVYANVGSGTASVRYAYWNGQTWTGEIVDDRARSNNELVGWGICIALDEKNQPYISYVNYSSLVVKYAFRRDGKWQTQAVDHLGGANPERNSIIVDHDGRPYIGYYDQGAGMLRVAWPSGTKWTVEIVDRNAAGLTSSMQIHNNVLWISYAGQGVGVNVARRSLPVSTTGKVR